MIIDLKVVTREILGLMNLSIAQIFYVYKPEEVVVVGEYEEFMLRLF